jgi:hypothetical protein
MSNNRLILGIGSGSTRDDFELFGYDYDHSIPDLQKQVRKLLTRTDLHATRSGFTEGSRQLPMIWSRARGSLSSFRGYRRCRAASYRRTGQPAHWPGRGQAA